MQMNQVASLRKNGQAGFTLIELIVVIVILGILAATALPRFADLGADARLAKMNAARGAIRGAAGMYHGRWLAAGSPTAGGTYDTIAVNGSGYPTNASIVAAAGLTDYDVSLTATAGTIAADTNHTACLITYTAADGTVGAAPAATDCD